jgi:ABC-2 type transport system permease protein
MLIGNDHFIMFDNLRNYWDLLIVMTEKELKVRYKRTIFGFLWVIINPLVQMIIIGFVFRFFIKQPIKNYYLYLLSGLLVWNFFNLSLTKASSSIVYERLLIKKAKFPRELIPISIILSNLVHLIIAFILLILLVIIFKTFVLFSVPIVLFGLFLLLIFTTGLSLLTSALNVRFRDVNFFVQAVLIVWFYITPIVYSVDFIPKRFIWVWRLNPMTSIVQLFQYAFAEAHAPGPAMITTNLLIILICVLVGVLIFIKESKNFDDWL